MTLHHHDGGTSAEPLAEPFSTEVPRLKSNQHNDLSSYAEPTEPFSGFSYMRMHVRARILLIKIKINKTRACRRACAHEAAAPKRFRRFRSASQLDIMHMVRVRNLDQKWFRNRFRKVRQAVPIWGRVAPSAWQEGPFAQAYEAMPERVVHG